MYRGSPNKESASERQKSVGARLQNNVFILGAGASVDSGAPVMSNFLDLAEDVHKKTPRSELEDVLNAITQVRPLYARARLDLENIENLFGLVDMAVQIGRFPGRQGDEVLDLRNNLVSLIEMTLHNSVRFSIRQTRIQPHGSYVDFVDFLSEIGAPKPVDFLEVMRGKRESFDFQSSLITFNYDLALDFAIGRNVEYGLSDVLAEGLSLFKLHGSLNWGFCERCNEPAVTPVESYRSGIPRGAESNFVIREFARPTCSGCGSAVTVFPSIVPPTWSKGGRQSVVQNVWRHAAEAISRADNVFVIGYSLPESDFFFRFLYSLSIAGDRRIRRFWVFDPDPDVEARFRDLLGSELAGRFRFEEVEFESAIEILRDELGVGGPRITVI